MWRKVIVKDMICIYQGERYCGGVFACAPMPLLSGPVLSKSIHKRPWTIDKATPDGPRHCHNVHAVARMTRLRAGCRTGRILAMGAGSDAKKRERRQRWTSGREEGRVRRSWGCGTKRVVGGNEGVGGGNWCPEVRYAPVRRWGGLGLWHKVVPLMEYLSYINIICPLPGTAPWSFACQKQASSWNCPMICRSPVLSKGSCLFSSRTS